MAGGRDRREPEGPEPHGEGNGYVESFNGRLRDELLNRELFLSVPEARYVLNAWREEHNERRPHSGLNWQTPAAYAASVADPPVGTPPRSAGQPPLKPYELSHNRWYKHRGGVTSFEDCPPNC